MMRDALVDALRAGAILLAPELGDLQLEVRDHGLGGALPGMGIGELGLGLIGSLGRTRQQRLERFDIVRKGRNDSFHDRDGITDWGTNEAQNGRATKKTDALSGALRTPGILRVWVGHFHLVGHRSTRMGCSS